MGERGKRGVGVRGQKRSVAKIRVLSYPVATHPRAMGCNLQPDLPS